MTFDSRTGRVFDQLPDSGSTNGSLARVAEHRFAGALVHRLSAQSVVSIDVLLCDGHLPTDTESAAGDF